MLKWLSLSQYVDGRCDTTSHTQRAITAEIRSHPSRAMKTRAASTGGAGLPCCLGSRAAAGGEGSDWDEMDDPAPLRRRDILSALEARLKSSCVRPPSVDSWATEVRASLSPVVTSPPEVTRPRHVVCSISPDPSGRQKRRSRPALAQISRREDAGLFAGARHAPDTADPRPCRAWESASTRGESERPRHKPRRTQSSSAAGSSLREKTRLRHELKPVSVDYTRRGVGSPSDPRAPDMSAAGMCLEGSHTRGQPVGEAHCSGGSSVGSRDSTEFECEETIKLTSEPASASVGECDISDTAGMSGRGGRTLRRQPSVIAEDTGVTRLSVSLSRGGRTGRRLGRRHTTGVVPTHRFTAATRKQHQSHPNDGSRARTDHMADDTADDTIDDTIDDTAEDSSSQPSTGGSRSASDSWEWPTRQSVQRKSRSLSPPPRRRPTTVALGGQTAVFCDGLDAAASQQQLQLSAAAAVSDSRQLRRSASCLITPTWCLAADTKRVTVLPRAGSSSPCRSQGRAWGHMATATSHAENPAGLQSWTTEENGKRQVSSQKQSGTSMLPEATMTTTVSRFWPRLENARHANTVTSLARIGVEAEDSWDSWDSSSPATSPNDWLGSEHGSDEEEVSAAVFQWYTEQETSVDDECSEWSIQRQQHHDKRQCRNQHRILIQQERQENEIRQQQGTLFERRQALLQEKLRERPQGKLQRLTRQKELLSELPEISTLSALPQSSSTYELPDYGKEHLMWCTEQQFDYVLQQLSPRGLLELIQLLQDAMLLEQATFDSLQQQLEASSTSDQHRHRLSAALCTSQARLTRLCGRSMRCFSQQALRARQRCQSTACDSDPAPDNSRQRTSPSSHKTTPPGSSGSGQQRQLSNARESALSSPEKPRQRRPSTAHEPTLPAPEPTRQRRPPTSRESTSILTSTSISSPTSLSPSIPTSIPTSRPDLEPNRQREPPSASRPTSSSAPSQTQSRLGAVFKRNLSFFQRAAHGLHARVSQSAAEAAQRGSGSVDSDGSCSVTSSSDGGRSSDRPESFGAGRFGGVTSQATRVTSEPVRVASESGAVGAGAADRGRRWSDAGGAAGVTGAADRGRRWSDAGGAAGVTGAVDGGRRWSDASGAVGAVRGGGTAVERIRQTQRSREHQWDEESLWETDSWEEELPPLAVRQRTDNSFPPGRREPQLQLPSDSRRSCEDLTVFGRPSRPSGTSGSGGGLTRARSCENGLNQSSLTALRPRTLSVSSLAAGPGGDRRSRSNLRKAPSVEEILESVKELRVQRQSGGRMGREQESPPQSPSADYQNVVLSPTSQSNAPPSKSPWTKVSIGGPGASGRRRGAPETDQSSYQNVWVGADEPSRRPEVIYDEPVSSGRMLLPSEPDQLYENVQWSGAPTYENMAPTELTSPRYDVPRASRVYDSPRRGSEAVRVGDEAARSGDADSEWDEDSLDGDLPGQRDVMSPDYDGDEERGGGPAYRPAGYYRAPAPESASQPPPEQTSLGQTRGPTDGQLVQQLQGQLDQQLQGQLDQQLQGQLDEQLDEGLGESDGRSHYNEDPGLEVILEEAEEEYVTTSEEEDEETEPAASLASLEGSEGIGSAEGDLRSHGSLERFSTLSSSGGHRSLDQAGDQEGSVQRDCSVDIYPETLRQRKHSKRSSQQTENNENVKAVQSRGSITDQEVSRPSLQNLLPSVKALKNQFEMSASQLTREGPRRGDRSMTTAQKSRSQAASHGESRWSEDTSRPQTDTVFDKFADVDELSLKSRIATKTWDPSALLKILYEVPQPAGRTKSKHRFTNIEGWLEKLPSGRKKATFWNAWKRRYFKAKDGFLYYYQTNLTEKPSLVLQLVGGHVELMDCSEVGANQGVPQTVISLDDGMGRYVVVRCVRGDEADRWHRALLTHTADDCSATYVQPVAVPPTPVSVQRRVIIDLGSTAVRAGLLLDQPTLPQLFFPSAVVTSSDGRHLAVGSAALRPSARAAGRLWFPLRAAAAGRRRLDTAAAAALLQLALRRLQLGPGELSLVLSVPHGLRAAVTAQLAPVLLAEFGVHALVVVEQSEVTLAAYGATTGVVVHVGDSTDVVPIVDGTVITDGITRLPYGGSRLQDHLRHFLLERRYSLVSPVESLLLRHVLERLCFVSGRYEEDVERCRADPTSLERQLPVRHLLGDSSSWKEIELGIGRFQVPEGLFNPEIWGLDHPGLHKLVQKAVQACPMDARRELLRTVCLAGGVTQLPGLAERLQSELDHLTPASVTPRVHASVYRYHAAYLGAGVLAASDRFQQRAVTRDIWRRHGEAAFDKWAT